MATVSVNQEQSAPVAGNKQKPAVVAFVNWSIPLKDGRSLRSSKGFPIFQNPDYPNKYEDFLIALAKEHGGSVNLTLECKVILNRLRTPDDLDLANPENISFLKKAVALT